MVREAEIDILWPTYTLQERPLLYLMDQPEVHGKGKCEEVPGVNPKKLKVNLRNSVLLLREIIIGRVQEIIENFNASLKHEIFF